MGTLAVAFSSGVAGTLTNPGNGVTVVQPIQRQPFGTLPTVCG